MAEYDHNRPQGSDQQPVRRRRSAPSQQSYSQRSSASGQQSYSQRTSASGQESSGRRVSARKRSQRAKHTGGAKVAGAILYVLVVIGLAGIIATMGWIWACDLLGLNKEYTSVTINVPVSSMVEVETTDDNGKPVTETRADMDSIVDELKEEGLIQYKWLFKLYAWFSHADRKIVPGTYELNTEMDYRALVVNMSTSSATRQQIDVTIPEGYTLDQIFNLLADSGVTTVEQLQEMAATHDYAFSWLKGHEPLGDYHRLEGYLFPDTYTFYLGEDPLYVINKMLVQFDAKMDEYLGTFTEDSEYSLHDIVTIASLIEKETDGTDYGKISSVIYNRLENLDAETVGFLQIDACLVYINGGKEPTLADREIDSPYNTYKYQGLPPGPIANPGIKALEAAMDPEDTNYYYYVLDPHGGEDGSPAHVFAHTFAEHQANIDRISRESGN